MKRTEALKLIANQLDHLNKKFKGVRDNFTTKELQEADVILTTLESAGMTPPSFWKENSHIASFEWEPENG